MNQNNFYHDTTVANAILNYCNFRPLLINSPKLKLLLVTIMMVIAVIYLSRRRLAVIDSMKPLLQNMTVTADAHSFWHGGLLNFSFSPDSQLIFTSGFDGALCCFKWKFVPNCLLIFYTASCLFSTSKIVPRILTYRYFF